MTWFLKTSRSWGGIFDWDQSNQRLKELDAQAADEKLWDRPEEAQALLKERDRLRQKISEITEVHQEREGLIELIELAEAEGDQSVVEESFENLNLLKKKTAHMGFFWFFLF